MARASVERWKEFAPAAHYNANELAKLCGISVRQLERDFRKLLERSPQDWLNEQRITVAQGLLVSGHSVKEVALDLGFKQVSHFCRQFKVQYHMTPSQFAESDLCRRQITTVVDR